MIQDWRYSDSKMQLRTDVLHTLLRNYGSHMNADGTPEHSTESIYACAHDWVSQGHPTADGVESYFMNNYVNQPV